jgi:5'-phosphate synthase pdxT subunit
LNAPNLKIGVLGLQGAVREHLRSLEHCGVEGLIIKRPEDLEQVAGLIIPGGESTAIRKLINNIGLLKPLEDFNRAQKPLFGTCAGLILLARDLVSKEQHSLGFMNIEVKRNSFGRQVDSFETDLEVRGLDGKFPAVFIRAPHIEKVYEGVEVLARFEDRIVMVRQKHLLGCSFHPELTDDHRITRLFVDMVKESNKSDVFALTNQ